jgi:hypothetical protein
VTRTDISKLYLRIRAEHPHEANRVLSLVSIFFNLAVAWGQLPEGHPNPAKMPKSARFEESPRDRPITSDELPRLLEAVAEETDPHIRSEVVKESRIRGKFVKLAGGRSPSSGSEEGVG